MKVAAMVLGILGSIATFFFTPLACVALSDQSSIWRFAILLFWALAIVALIGAILINSNPRVGRNLLCIAAIPCALGTVGALLSLSSLSLMLFGLCALLLGLATTFAYLHFKNVQSTAPTPQGLKEDEVTVRGSRFRKVLKIVFISLLGVLGGVGVLMLIGSISVLLEGTPEDNEYVLASTLESPLEVRSDSGSVTAPITPIPGIQGRVKGEKGNGSPRPVGTELPTSVTSSPKPSSNAAAPQVNRPLIEKPSTLPTTQVISPDPLSKGLISNQSTTASHERPSATQPKAEEPAVGKDGSRVTALSLQEEIEGTDRGMVSLMGRCASEIRLWDPSDWGANRVGDKTATQCLVYRIQLPRVLERYNEIIEQARIQFPQQADEIAKGVRQSTLCLEKFGYKTIRVNFRSFDVYEPTILHTGTVEEFMECKGPLRQSTEPGWQAFRLGPNGTLVSIPPTPTPVPSHRPYEYLKK